jgi:hypothetical protein
MRGAVTMLQDGPAKTFFPFPSTPSSPPLVRLQATKTDKKDSQVRHAVYAPIVVVYVTVNKREDLQDDLCLVVL